MKETVENVMTMSVKTDTSLLSDNRYRLITLHNHRIKGEGEKEGYGAERIKAEMDEAYWNW